MEVAYEGDWLRGMYLVGDTHATSLLAGSPLLEPATLQAIPWTDTGRATLFLSNPGNTAAEVDVLPTQKQKVGKATGYS